MSNNPVSHPKSSSKSLQIIPSYFTTDIFNIWSVVEYVSKMRLEGDMIYIW